VGQRPRGSEDLLALGRLAAGPGVSGVYH
jgi:hypothetical protein